MSGLGVRDDDAAAGLRRTPLWRPSLRPLDWRPAADVVPPFSDGPVARRSRRFNVLAAHVRRSGARPLVQEGLVAREASARLELARPDLERQLSLRDGGDVGPAAVAGLDRKRRNTALHNLDQAPRNIATASSSRLNTMQRSSTLCADAQPFVPAPIGSGRQPLFQRLVETKAGCSYVAVPRVDLKEHVKHMGSRRRSRTFRRLKATGMVCTPLPDFMVLRPASPRCAPEERFSRFRRLPTFEKLAVAATAPALSAPGSLRVYGVSSTHSDFAPHILPPHFDLSSVVSEPSEYGSLVDWAAISHLDPSITPRSPASVSSAETAFDSDGTMDQRTQWYEWHKEDEDLLGDGGCASISSPSSGCRPAPSPHRHRQKMQEFCPTS